MSWSTMRLREFYFSRSGSDLSFVSCVEVVRKLYGGSYSTRQNCAYNFHTTSIQLPYNLQRRWVVGFPTTHLRCRCKRWNSWILYWVAPSWQFSANSFELAIFCQLNLADTQKTWQKLCRVCTKLGRHATNLAEKKRTWQKGLRTWQKLKKSLHLNDSALCPNPRQKK